MLEYSIVGSLETLLRDLESFVGSTKADELMVVCSIHNYAARTRSSELVPEIARAR